MLADPKLTSRWIALSRSTFVATKGCGAFALANAVGYLGGDLASLERSRLCSTIGDS